MAKMKKKKKNPLVLFWMDLKASLDGLESVLPHTFDVLGRTGSPVYIALLHITVILGSATHNGTCCYW